MFEGVAIKFTSPKMKIELEPSTQKQFFKILSLQERTAGVNRDVIQTMDVLIALFIGGKESCIVFERLSSLGVFETFVGALPRGLFG